MRRAGSGRGAGQIPADNEPFIESGIATLERARSMEREGNLEGEAVAFAGDICVYCRHLLLLGWS